MTNKELKHELKAKLTELMKPAHFTAEIAARSACSTQYVYYWWRSDLIHPQLERNAIKLLEELKTEAAAKLETIKNPSL